MSYDLQIRADAARSRPVDAAIVRAEVEGLEAVRDREGRPVHLEMDIEANQVSLHVPYAHCSEGSSLPPAPVFARAVQIARKLGWEVFDPQQDCLATAASHRRFRWQLPIALTACARVSPDGCRLVVDAGEQLLAWDLSTRRQSWRHALAEYACSIDFDAETGRAFVLSASPATLASTLECVDSRTGATVWRLTRAKVTRASKVVVSRGRVFVDGDGIAEAELEPTTPRWGRRIEIESGGKVLRWSVAGGRIASSSRHGVSLWRLGQDEPERHIDRRPIAALALSPDGEQAAVGLHGKQLEGWSFSEDRPRWTLGRCGIPSALAFSTDGRTLLAGNDRGTLQTIDPATGTTIRRWKAHSDWVNAVQLVGPELAVSAARDGTVCFSNPTAGKLVGTLVIASADNWALFSPSGAYDGAGPGVRYGQSDALAPGELKSAFAFEAQDPASRREGLLGEMVR
jgi:hypothetical protein